jgi:hypothetical protein
LANLEPEIMNPERAADATIAGYLYQAMVSVLRWLELGENEVLLCEGDEDADKLIIRDGKLTRSGVSEQMKHYSSRLGPDSESVRTSIKNFLLAFVELDQEGESRKFIFTTTADQANPREGASPLLELWRDNGPFDALVSAIKERLPAKKEKEKESEKKLREKIEAGVAYLDKYNKWREFVESVKWRFGQPRTETVRTEIIAKLRAEHADWGPSGLLVDRLLWEVLKASSNRKTGCRILTHEYLNSQVAVIQTDINEWSQEQRVNKFLEWVEPLREIIGDEIDAGRLRELRGKVDNILWSGVSPISASELTPSVLLRADSPHSIPLIWRENEEREFREWLELPDRFSIKVVTGSGGAGKTKFATKLVEIAREMRIPAGFFRKNLRQEDVQIIFRLRGRVLVAIDYAEARQETVSLFLDRISTLDSDKMRIRLLLLARSSTDWWKDICSQCSLPKKETFDKPKTITPLKSLAEQLSARKGFYRKILGAFAEKKNTKVVPFEVPDLQDDHYKYPLFLGLAALAILEGSSVETQQELLDTTLDHEERYWFEAIKTSDLKGLPAKIARKAARKVMAVITIREGVEPEEAIEIVNSLGLGLKDSEEKAFIAALSEVYTGKIDGELPPLQPDMLGDHLVAKVVDDEEDMEAARVFLEQQFEEKHPDSCVARLMVLLRNARVNGNVELVLNSALENGLWWLRNKAEEIKREQGWVEPSMYLEEIATVSKAVISRKILADR